MASFDHDITPGTEAVVEAEVDFYPDRGDCQLLVTEYWPLGESTRQQELEQLEAKLASEGLVDETRKQSVPAHPDCIGLVTSPARSAREDVQATVDERSPRTEVRLCGATVQGERAVPSLLEAVETLDRRIRLAYDGVVEAGLDRDIEQGYRALVVTRLDTLEGRLDTATADLELAAESDAARDRVTRRRLGDLEARIDRLEEIAEQVEEGEIDLATARELREEADEHLVWLREELDVDGSTLVDVSGE